MKPNAWEHTRKMTTTKKIAYQKLSIINFRSYKQKTFEFSPEINLIIGKNGIGKTNLLEAINFVGILRGFAPINNLVNFSTDFFSLRAEFYDNSKAVVSYSKKQGKKIILNDVLIKKLSEYIGTFPTVVMLPQNTALIFDAPALLREWLNKLLSQADKEYLHKLIQYNSALKQRNLLLKQNFADTKLLELYEQKMRISAEIISAKRYKFIEDFNLLIKKYYGLIADEEIELKYYPSVNDYSENIWENTRTKDFEFKYTTKGIHRDVLKIIINGNPAKYTASQGQAKSIILALKFAETELLQILSGKTPILLLDELTSKLDKNRISKITELLKSFQSQIFITDVSLELSSITEGFVIKL